MASDLGWSDPLLEQLPGLIEQQSWHVLVGVVGDTDGSSSTDELHVAKLPRQVPQMLIDEVAERYAAKRDDKASQVRVLSRNQQRIYTGNTIHLFRGICINTTCMYVLLSAEGLPLIATCKLKLQACHSTSKCNRLS